MVEGRNEEDESGDGGDCATSQVAVGGLRGGVSALVAGNAGVGRREEERRMGFAVKEI